MQAIKIENTPILNALALRGDEKSPSPITLKDIVEAVNNLKEKLQREHDLNREQHYRTLLIAIHTDTWER